MPRTVRLADHDQCKFLCPFREDRLIGRGSLDLHIEDRVRYNLNPGANSPGVRDGRAPRCPSQHRYMVDKAAKCGRGDRVEEAQHLHDLGSVLPI
jgi:hypothetical protein